MPGRCQVSDSEAYSEGLGWWAASRWFSGCCVAVRSNRHLHSAASMPPSPNGSWASVSSSNTNSFNSTIKSRGSHHRPFASGVIKQAPRLAFHAAGKLVYALPLWGGVVAAQRLLHWGVAPSNLQCLFTSLMPLATPHPILQTGSDQMENNFLFGPRPPRLGLWFFVNKN